MIESPAGLRELGRHFQAFIMVYDPQGKPLYFRYYDPRVFRIYLPTCNESELKTVFGPVNSFYVEGEDRELFNSLRSRRAASSSSGSSEQWAVRVPSCERSRSMPPAARVGDMHTCPMVTRTPSRM